MTWVAIAVGGALGSMARHAVNRLVNTPRFPWGTVIVNLSGCFVIGLLAGLLVSKRMTLPIYGREFVFVGVRRAERRRRRDSNRHELFARPQPVNTHDECWRARTS